MEMGEPEAWLFPLFCIHGGNDDYGRDIEKDVEPESLFEEMPVCKKARMELTTCWCG